MLVGTNAAIRTSAIRKGYVDSITEDMATSLKIHATKNEATGGRWRSVYTPDLVAVGEGPSSWTEFFGQQARWSAGTFDAIIRQVWRVGFRLRPGAMLHYFLMLTYYPSVAIGWILGIGISACYLGFGITSLRTDAAGGSPTTSTWRSCSSCCTGLCGGTMSAPTNRPDPRAFPGWLVSALTAPIYARSLINVLLRRKMSFNVTAKGSVNEPRSAVEFPVLADVGGRAERPDCPWR